jgi:putative transposase
MPRRARLRLAGLPLHIIQRGNNRSACYIELNPVRAGMVSCPRDYGWSSYLSNAEGAPSRLLTPHGEYVALGAREEGRLEAYRALFRTELDSKEVGAIRLAANGGYALGSERFKAEIAAALGRRVEPGVSGRPRKNDQPFGDSPLAL